MQTTTEPKPKNRGGRPPKAPEDKKSIIVKIYLTTKQRDQLVKRQEKVGFKHLAPFLLELAINGQTLQEVALRLDPDSLREINAIGRNLNQMSKHRNSGGDWHPSFNEEVMEAQQILGRIFQVLMRSKKKRRVV